MVIIDSLANSDIDTLQRIESIIGLLPHCYKIDMTDSFELNKVLSIQSDAKAVIHFTALKVVKESSEQPLNYYRNNLYALINLISGMNKVGIHSLVFSSSSTVYGEGDEMPLKETYKSKPASSPYGNTKKIAENILRDICKTDPSFHVISLRYFNPIGAHPSGNGFLPAFT